MKEQDAERRIKELRELLKKAEEAYYQEAQPIMTDREFDSYLDELEDLEQKFDLQTEDSPTQRIGGKPSEHFPTVEHPQPMLSLNNTYNEGELRDFDQRIKNNLGHEDFSYLAELKFDGAALRLRYEEGNLVIGATRGDGSSGDDITPNVKTIKDIPLKLSSDAYNTIEVRGEAYMERQAFVRLNEHREQEGHTVYANPRNLTAGSLKMLDPRKVARRPIRFFCYDLLLPNSSQVPDQKEKMGILQELGLPVCSHFTLCNNIEEVLAIIEKWNELRHNLPYDTDGVVIKVNKHELREQLGSTAKAPRWAIAYKFEAEQATTTIQQISLQVGRLGTITPVAELTPVELAGTTVKRASLHNEDEIHRKDIRPGDQVVVEKAGEIIPQVMSVVNPDRRNRAAPFSMPEKCPACGDQLVRLDDEVALRCLNTACPPQVRIRIEHFASRDAMDIDGLGEAIVEQLVSQKIVETYADLYQLKKKDILPLERMGDKSASNLLQAINASKKQPYERVLYALGIRFVGKTVAADLAKHFTTINKLMDATQEELVSVDNIGPSIAESVHTFFNREINRHIVERLKSYELTFTYEEKKKSDLLKDKNFVLTGSLPTLTRKEAKELIEKHGGNSRSSVSKNTDYLLTGSAAGSKLDKARSLNIPIISEDEFRSLIEQ